MGLNNMKKIFLLIILSIIVWAFVPSREVIADKEEVDILITQIDTSRFPEVTVYISATDENGEPVSIDPNGINLQEDGQTVIPDRILGSGEIGPLTTMLVMDVSGSMNAGGKLVAAKEAAIAYIHQMRPGDSGGLLVFNTSMELIQEITDNKDALMAAVRELDARKDTAMYDALVFAVKNLEAVDGRKAIIVLTDGLDNMSKSTPKDVVEAIGPAGLSISTIGLGDPSHGKGAQTALDEHALIALAGDAGGVYAYAEAEDALREVYERYGKALQAEYTLTYASPSIYRDGVNRSLTISYDEAATFIEVGKYNPGGIVPETSVPETWSLFLTLLVGLCVLLLIPTVVKYLIPMFSKENGEKPKGNIKLRSSIRLKE
jgi:VWFA-related protein